MNGGITNDARHISRLCWTLACNVGDEPPTSQMITQQLTSKYEAIARSGERGPPKQSGATTIGI